MAKVKAKKAAKKLPGEAPSSLSFRQRLFVNHYLGESNGNASEAARLAGYPHPRVASARLLANASIRVAIDSKVAEAALPAAEVLARLAEHATADIGDCLTIGPGGAIGLDLAEMKRLGMTRLIKKLRPTAAGYAIELYDAQSALDKLARYHGLYKDLKVDPTAAAPIDPAEAARIYKAVAGVLDADDMGHGGTPGVAPA